MQPHQRRVLSRIVGEIDRYKESEASSLTVLNNIWGLITAAEVDRTVEGEDVRDLYHAASAADDARRAWMPVEARGTDGDLEAALDRLRAWAVTLSDESGESG